jgi:hypothetical protein
MLLSDLKRSLRCIMLCWRQIAVLCSTLLLTGSLAGSLRSQEKVVKVFILAGQSNMEGKAPNKLLEYQATAPKTQKLFAHLRKNGEWIVRDDVFIKFLDRKGPLTIGFGSPDRTGPELEFGFKMGQHFEEPVLLIKTAWGGHSLYKNFRPPSAGLPPGELLQKELDQARKQVQNENEKHNRNDPLPTLKEIKASYGSSYREMMKEVGEVTENLEQHFPELKGYKPEITGFVWFQGWNDQYDGAEKTYAFNMQYFIRDVRKDLKSPKLPFVIAAMGQNGSSPAAGELLTIREAQLAMNDVPDFKGNVNAFRTDLLVDKDAEALFGTWERDRKTHQDQWDETGGDYPYHYLGSAIWFNRIGAKMGDSMIDLLGSK